MNDPCILLDPTPEDTPIQRQRREPLATLEGRTVALLDISKARGNVLLNRLHRRLTERGVAVKRYTKPTFAKPIPAELAQTIVSQCDVVVEALAD